MPAVAKSDSREAASKQTLWFVSFMIVHVINPTLIFLVQMAQSAGIGFALLVINQTEN